MGKMDRMCKILSVFHYEFGTEYAQYWMISFFDHYFGAEFAEC